MREALGEAMPRTAAFFNWKHFLSPFGHSLILLAEDEQGLVGLRAMMRWRFRYQNRVLEAVRPVDTATHPRFRRRGLFKHLTMRLVDALPDEGVDVVFNTPNEKSQPGYLKMGWKPVLKQTIWTRLGGKFSVRGAEVRGPYCPGTLTLRSHRRSRGLHTDRGSSYYDWRFGGAGGLKYQAAVRDGAAVVFRTRNRNGRSELTVVEIVAPTTAHIPVAASLLRAVVREGKEMYVVAMAGSLSREAAVLALAGFLPIPGVGPELVMRPVRSRTPPELDGPKMWPLQISDLEVF